MKQIALFIDCNASSLERQVNQWLQNNPYVKVDSFSFAVCVKEYSVLIVYIMVSDMSLVSNT